jgi:hypothetical protein
MKILLYTGHRTGSLNFGEWLQQELNIKYYHEPLNIKNINRVKIDIYEVDSGIIKISPGDDFNYNDSFNFFDKNIVLIRENTLAQSESMVWSWDKKRWHFLEFLSSNYYSIPDDFLVINKEKIENLNRYIDVQNEYLKTLKNCLHITYEEFYYSDIGIKKLEEYLNFEAKTTPNPKTKLRNNKNSLI